MSITDKQLEANRANAQKSTGPKTPEGKTRSRMNARKHGFTGHATITTDEDHEAWLEFSGPYVESLKPVGAAEHYFARAIVHDSFRLNRLKAVEENTFSHGETHQSCDFEAEDHRIHHAVAQAKVFTMDQRTFDRLSIYEQRIGRNIERNMKLLVEMQARRKAEEQYDALLESKAKPLTRTASTTSEPNGFDFSTTLWQAQTSTPEAKEAPLTPPKAA